jgi:hypothetical protein
MNLDSRRNKRESFGLRGRLDEEVMKLTGWEKKMIRTPCQIAIGSEPYGEWANGDKIIDMPKGIGKHKKGTRLHRTPVDDFDEVRSLEERCSFPST